MCLNSIPPGYGYFLGVFDRNPAYLGSQAHKEDGLRMGFAHPNAQAGNRQQANQRP
jgi:hypothetical protein